MIFHLPLAHDLNLVGAVVAPYGLTIDGLDIIASVPYESIAITEAGPGAVSAMRFTVLDLPNTSGDGAFDSAGFETTGFTTVGGMLLKAIANGAVVRMHDYVRDSPMFYGFLERLAITPWAATGRTIDVSAYGVESLLDTTIIAGGGGGGNFGVPTTRSFRDVLPGTTTRLRYQEVLQFLAGFAPLRAGMSSTELTRSSQALPIANSALYSLPTGASVVVVGMSIRNALDAVLDASSDNNGVEGTLPPPIFLTVDFYGGVRSWAWMDPDQYGAAYPGYPSDWATLTIDNTQSGALAVSDIHYEKDSSPGAIVNAVYVQGANEAGTGWVVGDTTTGRHEAYTTAQSTDTRSKFSAGASILGSRQRAAGRGSLRLSNFTPINAHPGGRMLITDPRMGWTASEFVITQIDKTIANKVSGKQDWDVTFVSIVDGPAAGWASITRLAGTRTRGTPN